MLALRRPSPQAIRTFLDRQARREFSYAAVGATAGHEFPSGYDVDRTRVRLGDGEHAFSAARASLERWAQFRLGWVEPWTFDRPIRSGETVAILARVGGLWWLNACRIVYAVDEQGPQVHRFGFAYGTLPDHAESGEERFAVEWDRADDSVWYDIVAFSRPQTLLCQLGYLYVRRVQKRFARDSAAAMVSAVARRGVER